MKYSSASLFASVVLSFAATPFAATPLAVAQPPAHAHHHGEHGDQAAAHGDADAEVERPKIFLDKSPRIVEYQLGRLDNRRLLLVERSTDDAKYAPVYEAILTRSGISPQFRDEALDALVKLRELVKLPESDAASVLLDAIDGLPVESRQEQQTFAQIASMLLDLPAETLGEKRATLADAARSGAGPIRGVGFAGLIVAGASDKAWEIAESDDQATLAWLEGVTRVPGRRSRNDQRDRVVSLTDGAHPIPVRQAAVTTLAVIPKGQADTFTTVAKMIGEPELRDAAVRTLLKVPDTARDDTLAAELVKRLVAHAEATPKEDRTNDAFIDAMQLADQLFTRLPVDAARAARERLREITVRVVRIRTVEEEMRYDLPYFAVEAGRPVQLVLQNEDLMPHNLVITTPESLQDVAQAGLAVGPRGGWQGKPYVPESPQVLFATGMVQPHQQERLTFDAPSEPGEYPYVCTFPQHWYRMYGVMVVVEDLDAWLQDPVEPENPIGSNRSFVQSWTVDDFRDDLQSGLRGRSPEIGQRLFAEASCFGCHRIGDEGGVIGPRLDETFERWKGDTVAVLREILEPSHRIDDQYAMHLVLTADGQTISGIVVKEDRDAVTLLTNPESPEPTVIEKDDIEEMVKSSTSMMPKALLDQYTRDEVLEILAYIKSSQR